MGSVEKGHIYGKFIRTRGNEHKILGGTPLSAFIGKGKGKEKSKRVDPMAMHGVQEKKLQGCCHYG